MEPHAHRGAVSCVVELSGAAGINEPMKPFDGLNKAYDLLGVYSSDSTAAVKASYRQMMIAWHPDKHAGNPQMSARATAETKKINEAYRLILDARERAPQQAKSEPQPADPGGKAPPSGPGSYDARQRSQSGQSQQSDRTRNGQQSAWFTKATRYVVIGVFFALARNCRHMTTETPPTREPARIVHNEPAPQPERAFSQPERHNVRQFTYENQDFEFGDWLMTVSTPALLAKEQSLSHNDRIGGSEWDFTSGPDSEQVFGVSVVHADEPLTDPSARKRRLEQLLHQISEPGDVTKSAWAEMTDPTGHSADTLDIAIRRGSLHIRFFIISGDMWTILADSFTSFPETTGAAEKIARSVRLSQK